MIPQVYSGLGATNNLISNSSLNNRNILSGPNWIPKLTGNLKKDGGRWYCLDLLGKYHSNSKLKQFHALTFYFRHTRAPQAGAIITSMLPESFTYSIGGNYTNPIKIMGSEIVNTVVKEFTNGNMTTSFNVDTSLSWQSPKRMELTFRIPVFDDSASGSHVNYQEAIDLFGEAILPELARNGTYESVPGPNLLTTLEYRARNGKHTTASSTLNSIKNGISDATKWTVGGQESLWDRISIQVGGVLLLDWCIIKDLKVTFPNTKAMVLHNYTGMHKAQVDDRGNETYKVHLQPLQAELEVTVATVMGITRATFKDMLYQTESTKQDEKDGTPSGGGDVSSTKVNDSGSSVTKSIKTPSDTAKFLNNLVPQPQMSLAPGYNNDLIYVPENNMSLINPIKQDPFPVGGMSKISQQEL